MTTSAFDIATRPSTGRSRQPRSSPLRVVGAVLALLVGVGVFLGVRELGRVEQDLLTAVFVEPGSADPAVMSANVAAQLDHAADRQSGLLVAAVLDDNDATRYFGSLACEPGENPMICSGRQDAERDVASDAVNDILAAQRPAHVDVFAPLRRLGSHLDQHPAEDGVEAILNISGRHSDPAVDLASPDLDSRIDEVVEAALDNGRFPADTTGITVHLVLTSSSDAAHDQAIAEVFGQLMDRTGGELGLVTQRWHSEGQVLALPDFDVADVDTSPEPGIITFTLGAALFDIGSAELRPDATAAIAAVAEELTKVEDLRSLRVAGYADTTGTAELNLQLSHDRAIAVRDALAAHLGHLADEIHAQGHGSLPDDGTTDEREQNRRVDIIATHR